ncbi:thioredoxin-like 3-3 isoform X1 [Gastrolobium bilobum]|uniref:thioredoxin-like 3-3 isoform X1 n=1 Tax=Gastrolobium bilobum TaxID=150636 RepID=UPI002AAFEEC2|nr:thioredoxin-like 3-3 isoform X1 [Gastrolobium bilobum]
MEGSIGMGVSSTSSNEDDKAKKGLEGTAIDLPINRHANLKSASSDDDFTHILAHIKSSKTPAVINYGASWCSMLELFQYLTSVEIRNPIVSGNHLLFWCRVCSQILPAFCRLSNNFPKLSFIYADIDECPETTQHIRYTPTFQFFRDGERVDEMYGAGEERLHDRLWLHS